MQLIKKDLYLDRIKVVVTDVDGTLLDSRGKLSEFSRKVIKEYLARGGNLIFATGKLFKTIYPLCREFSLRSKQIAANGAVLIDPLNNHTRVLSQLDTDTMRKIIDILQKHSIEFVIYEPERVYFKKGTVSSTNLDLIVAGGEDLPLSIPDYTRWNWKYPLKILSFVNQDETFFEKTVRKEIKEVCKKVEIIRTTPYFLEFLKNGTSKFGALKVILEEMGINLTEVVAFGDHENDLELVKKSGIGVAVANASPKVKKVADYVTASNDEDGVATFIQRFILGGTLKH